MAKAYLKLAVTHWVYRRACDLARKLLICYIQFPPVLSIHLCSNRYETPSVALNCGMMLRECVRYEPLAKMILQHEDFFCLFHLVELPTFDIASDAFSTLRVCHISVALNMSTIWCLELLKYLSKPVQRLCVHTRSTPSSGIDFWLWLKCARSTVPVCGWVASSGCNCTFECMANICLRTYHDTAVNCGGACCIFFGHSPLAFLLWIVRIFLGSSRLHGGSN